MAVPLVRVRRGDAVAALSHSTARPLLLLGYVSGGHEAGSGNEVACVADGRTVLAAWWVLLVRGTPMHSG